MNEVGPMFHDLGNREVGVPFNVAGVRRLAQTPRNVYTYAIFFVSGVRLAALTIVHATLLNRDY